MPTKSVGRKTKRQLGQTEEDDIRAVDGQEEAKRPTVLDGPWLSKLPLTHDIVETIRKVESRIETITAGGGRNIDVPRQMLFELGRGQFDTYRADVENGSSFWKDWVDLTVKSDPDHLIPVVLNRIGKYISTKQRRSGQSHLPVRDQNRQ